MERVKQQIRESSSMFQSFHNILYSRAEETRHAIVASPFSLSSI